MSCIKMFLNTDLVCKVCAKAFKFQSGLSRHARTHNKLTVNCDCGLVFSRKDNLKRHQLMSTSCRALEFAYVPSTFKSDDSSNAIHPELTKHNAGHSSHISINAFTQTEKHKDIKSVSDDAMTVDEDANYNIDSSETVTKHKLILAHKNSEDKVSASSDPTHCQIIRKGKLTKIRQSSEDNDSDSSAPVIKNRKKKHRMHRLKKIRKLMKSKKQSLSNPSNPHRMDLSNQYGIDLSDTYGSNIVRKLSVTQNIARFKPHQRIQSISGVGLFGQLSGA